MTALKKVSRALTDTPYHHTLPPSSSISLLSLLIYFAEQDKPDSFQKKFSQYIKNGVTAESIESS
jgi:hypothetical protein